MLPLEPMGVSLEIQPDLGPVIHSPIRGMAAVQALRPLEPDTGVPFGLEAIRGLRSELADGRAAVIGFCGAPYTLASYMIEGGGSRHYVETKKLMYRSPRLWGELMQKLVRVLAEYSIEQVRAGADAFQIFDSWVGSLSVEDYRELVLPHTKLLVQEIRKSGVPVIYFGTDTATLLTSMQERASHHGYRVVTATGSGRFELAEERHALETPVQLPGEGLVGCSGLLPASDAGCPPEPCSTVGMGGLSFTPGMSASWWWRGRRPCPIWASS